MLTSVGKLSSIGEILTIKFAASKPPVDLHENSFDSFVVSVHFGGTVKLIPCWAHLISCPPDKAACCDAVAAPCSAVVPPMLEPEFESDVEPEVEDPCFNLFERLQSDKEKPRTRITGRYFIDEPHSVVCQSRALLQKTPV